MKKTDEPKTGSASTARDRSKDEAPKRQRKDNTPSPQEHSTVSWGAGDYGTLEKSGALKLSDSRVAPLIATARGYVSIENSNHKKYAKEELAMDARGKQARSFNRLFENGSDVMDLPWYSASTVYAYAKGMAREEGESEEDFIHRYVNERSFRPSVHQFRPSTPAILPDGSYGPKYTMVVDSATVIDSHPATPESWFASSPNILMTEGVIKGDSALTELLLDAGVPVEALSATPGSVLEARAILTNMMEKVEVADRFIIMSIAGVTNWRQRPEWVDIHVRDRKFYIAFDGDVASNTNVFRQAKSIVDFLEQRRAEPEIIQLNIPSIQYYGEDILDEHGKVRSLGIDDYFAKAGGSWRKLLSLATPELPAPPDEGDVAQPGVFRISPDGQRLQVGTEIKNEYSNTSETKWMSVPNHDIGGRVKSKVTQRKPSDKEREDGKFRPASEDHAEIGVEVEVSYVARDSQRTTALITGPASILAEHPADWHKQKVGAKVPSDLLLSPHWPPRKFGSEWVAAMKAHRMDDLEETTIWKQMGWVPTQSNLCNAFIIGDRVIAASTEDREATVTGIGEQLLPGASNFGVIDSYRFEEDDEARLHPLPSQQIDEIEREVIQQMFDAFIDFGPWEDDSYGAIVLAAGLRPVAVKRNMLTMYFLGEPGSGKTWTAGCLMAFWQAWAGAWATLPASAKDTAAATESALSMAPIWGVDDWAPSPNANTATADEERMGTIVRSVHNGVGKRRSSATMSARETFDPVSMLIITAENELSVGSARERTIPMTFQRGALGGLGRDGKPVGIDLINAMNMKEGTPSKLSAALIYDIIGRVHSDFGDQWRELILWENTQFEALHRYAQRIALSLTPQIDPGPAARQMIMAADLGLGLIHLSMLTERLGLSEITRRIVNPDFLFDGSEPDKDTLVYKVLRHVVETYRRKDDTRPGQSLITTIRDMLLSRTAHFKSGERAEHAPFDGSDQVALNAAVGWSFPRGGNGPMEPQGTPIGWVFSDANGDPFFVIHPENAFKEAQRQYPKTILPGSNKTTYIDNIVHDENIIHPDYKKGWTINRGATGTVRGIPLRWDAIMGDREIDRLSVARAEKSKKGEEK